MYNMTWENRIWIGGVVENIDGAEKEAVLHAIAKLEKNER
jgi:hypothetical protein